MDNWKCVYFHFPILPYSALSPLPPSLDIAMSKLIVKVEMGRLVKRAVCCHQRKQFQFHLTSFFQTSDVDDDVIEMKR